MRGVLVVLLPLVMLSAAAPIGATGGAWSATSFFGPPWAEGVFADDVAIATNGATPATLVFDALGNRVIYSPDPFDGAAFETVPAAIPPTGSVTLRLTLDELSRPHAFILRETSTTYTLVYATRGTSGWISEIVRVGLAPEGFRLWDVAADEAGRPHALVSLAGGDMLLSKDSPVWQARFLGPGVFTLPDLAVAPDGTLHTCRGSPEGVVHEFGDAASAWKQELVWAGRLQNGACSIAAPTGDDVRIAFDAPPRVILHAQRGPDRWTITTVPTPAFGGEIPVTEPSFAAAGGAFLSAWSPAFPAPHLYRLDHDGWAEELLPGLNAERSPTSIAPGPTKPFLAASGAEMIIWSWT